MKKYDCSKCFKHIHMTPEMTEEICKWCKEKNGLFYDPDLTDLKGHVAVVLKDMQMPENCTECRFAVDKRYEAECYFTGKPITITKRQCKCPLQEVKERNRRLKNENTLH